MRLILFLFICSSALADPYDELMDVYSKLPNAYQMTLLQKVMDKVSRHFDYSKRAAAVIYCISGDVDLIVLTGSVAGCMDKDLNRYYFTAEGGPVIPGSSLGVSSNIFAAILYSKKSKDISGSYRGMQYGMSPLKFGVPKLRVGANYGRYARRTGNGLLEVDHEEKLRLEGITFSIGPSIDVSGGLIQIGRL